AAHLEAVLARQHHVQQDQIESALASALRSCFAVPRNLHLVTFQGQVFFQTHRDARFVLHYQDSDHPYTSAMGSSTVNELPFPGALSTEISPPCASTICRASASPTPVPPMLASFGAAPRVNFRKISFCSLAGIPRPRSRTHTMIRWPAAFRSTHTVWHSGEYFTALSSKFQNTRASDSRSACTMPGCVAPSSSTV